MYVSKSCKSKSYSRKISDFKSYVDSLEWSITSCGSASKSYGSKSYITQIYAKILNHVQQQELRFNLS